MGSYEVSDNDGEGLIEHSTGDMRLKNGMPSMCLGHRMYGGGSGYVWATQDEAAEFSIRGPIKGYLYGICESVNSTKKSISIRILKGSTWGDFATGNTTEVSAELIGRYHEPSDIETLVEWSQNINSKVYRKEVFLRVSEKELTEAFKDQLEQVSITLLGKRAYENSLKFINAYSNFIENVSNAKGDFLKQPSKKLLASSRQVREILGLEGTRIPIGEDQIFPVELSPRASAAFGAVCGALAGDAAGGVLEFLGRSPTRSDVDHALGMPGGGAFSLAPGQITDDGELTICLLRSLANSEGKYESERVARSYIDWAQSHPFDMGQATGSALQVSSADLIGAAQSVFQAAAANNAASKANGALMRISPLGVAAAALSEKDAIVFAMADARMTHPNVSCTQANAAYVLAIRHLVLNPGDRKGAISAAQKFLEEVSSEVTEWLDEAMSGDLPDALPEAGFVRIAFTYAFFHLNQGSSYRAAISDTLIRGGDTDTNACIVGGLIGAYRGLNNLLVSEASRKMIYPVMMCDPSLGQIRPDVYHASSVPLLLRRLVESIGLPDA